LSPLAGAHSLLAASLTLDHESEMAKSSFVYRVVQLTFASLALAAPLVAQAGGAPGAAPTGAPGAAPAGAPAPNDPQPAIDATTGRIVVKLQEFATIPTADNIMPRMMMMLDEPGTRRLFVNDMRGPLYSVSYDGRTVTKYVDINDPQWDVQVNSQGSERGFQNFAFHPQFAQQGTPGYGRFYTWTDVRTNTLPADFKPNGGQNTHHTVLFEWVARNPAAATYDGAAPREMARFEQPFPNHNGGALAFNPTARQGDDDFGLLYMGVADGGSGGDPIGNAQRLSSGFGKILRIDPLGRNSANGKYGIPATNRFAADNDPSTLGEIYAYGIRNSQRFAWDPTTRRMFMSDIGQNTVEKISLVTNGANLGWNVWEASYRYTQQGVGLDGLRSQSGITYPLVEYDHRDPLFGMRNVAVSLGGVVRTGNVPALRNKVLFSDFPNGEMFYFDADNLPQGGQGGFHRVMFDDGSGAPKTFLEIVRQKTIGLGRPQPATRADLRFGMGADGRVFLINKADGTVRLIVP
jgi:glucose/arabinose dehydrogenase